MVARNPRTFPIVVQRIAFADDHRRISDVTDVQFVSSDENNARRAARGAREAR